MRNRPDVDVKPYVQHHPVFGYAYRPGACLTLPTPAGNEYTIRVNAQGIRSDREFTHRPRPGVFRVLVVGDSVAAGQYCANHERFTEQLEAKQANLEVINLALEGTGTDQQLLIFKEAIRRFDFDLLLLCPYIENIRRNLADYRVATEIKTGRRVLTPKPRFVLSDGQLELRNVPVPDHRPAEDEADADQLGRSNHASTRQRLRARANRVLEMLRLKRWAYRLLPHEPFPEYRQPAGAAWRLMEALIREFIVLADGRPVVIAPQVYHAYLELRLARNDLRRFATLTEPGRVWCIDITPHLRRLTPTQRRDCYWSDDCHLTPYGHRVAAEALYQELRAIGVLPTGPSGSRDGVPDLTPAEVVCP